jgi:hypothetical protein
MRSISMFQNRAALVGTGENSIPFIPFILQVEDIKRLYLL